jgi:hypothetical protein
MGEPCDKNRTGMELPTGRAGESDAVEWMAMASLHRFGLQDAFRPFEEEEEND